MPVKAVVPSNKGEGGSGLAVIAMLFVAAFFGILFFDDLKKLFVSNSLLEPILNPKPQRMEALPPSQPQRTSVIPQLMQYRPTMLPEKGFVYQEDIMPEQKPVQIPTMGYTERKWKAVYTAV